MSTYENLDSITKEEGNTENKVWIFLDFDEIFSNAYMQTWNNPNFNVQ